MEENNNVMYCSHCGAVIGEDEDYETIDGDIVCADCVENHTTTCDRCGRIIWTNESYGDDYTTLCSNCYHNHYTRCSCCDTLLHEDDAYHLDGYDYCSDCYHDEVDKCRSIHDYGYKPEPIFYGDIFAALSELEREQTLQRQREGIAIAKSQGKYKGRQPIAIDWVKFGQLYEQWKSGTITAVWFQKEMGLQANTFYRRLREYERGI
jgi:hypothetical protein